MKKLDQLFFYLLLLLTLIWAWFWRSPFLFKVREFQPYIFVLWSIFLLGYFLILKRGWNLNRARISFLCLWLTSFAWISYQELRFSYIRERVLQADPQLLQNLGSHFIIGFTREEEIRKLVEKGAVGGVFFTHRNIQGKPFEQVSSEIAELQQKRKELKLPPLWIAADQEGGLVSRLSPLVPSQPPLSEVIQQAEKTSDLESLVQKYAQIQGVALSKLGINLNFSPVADLKLLSGFSRVDRSNIALRAISSNAETVADVAKVYSRELKKFGVAATLKHFPGLGRISQDTHVSSVSLEEDLELLKKTDWLPYAAISQDSEAWIMMGHVCLSRVDPQNPASVSKKVIQEILRRDLGFKGKIITDDLVMAPTYSRAGGVGKASHDALKAGVDYVLLAYDPDLYYEAMYYLLKQRSLGSEPFQLAPPS